MSKVLNALRECDERISGGDIIMAIVSNTLYETGGVKRDCWDVVDLTSETKPYSSDDGADKDNQWLLARCYSVAQLKEFLRNYGRDQS